MIKRAVYLKELKTDYGRGASGITDIPAFGRGASGITLIPAFGLGASGMTDIPAFGRGASGITLIPALLIVFVKPLSEIAIFTPITRNTVIKSERKRFELDLLLVILNSFI
jgi:hypothetical protein